LPNAFYDEGLRQLRERDWAGAIRSLAWAKEAEPGSPRVWLSLIEAYEAAADAETEPDLLQQAFNVCRDLRDRRLPMTPEEQRDFFVAFVRVRDRLVAALASGWTPPPPREQVHSD
jgi:hypothetical protein